MNNMPLPETADDRKAAILEYIRSHPDYSLRGLVRDLGIPRTTARRIVRSMRNNGAVPDGAPQAHNREHVTIDTQQDTAVASSLSARICTLDQLLAATKVDLAVWEVERHTINKWEVAMREPATTVGGAGGNAVISTNRHGGQSTLWTRGSSVPLHESLVQIKIWLKRKSPQITATEAIIARLEKSAPVFNVPAIRRAKLPHKRALEIDIMDPHIGLLCQYPEADAPWDIDMAASAIMRSIDDLVDKAMKFGPFDQVFMPFGNDFVHSDTLGHTTTAGTAQPESISWHHVYDRAEGIAIAMLERLREVAKELYVYEIPGNHSRMADFTLARLLRAHFRHDKNVFIDASSSPYKFHRYGTTLIGFEHGHSVSAIRLAALMANERRRDCAEVEYKEWHLGDQHRKGSSNPAAFEEQGVSIEYIPGLTSPNEWHRLKAFNHQKRGAMAFVYDFNTGPIARLQHNIETFFPRQSR